MRICAGYDGVLDWVGLGLAGGNWKRGNQILKAVGMPLCDKLTVNNKILFSLR